MPNKPDHTHFCAAVIGTGFIGPVHVEGLRRAGVEPIGILGSSAAKSQAAAQRLGIECGYESLDQLLADERVDCVHVTSPNQAHFEQASRCLQAGKHVLCEKPLAMNSTESAALVALANSKGLAAGVNYNIRYYPLCIEAAERRKAGELGSVHHVAGSYVQDWLFHPSDFNWRVLSSQGGELRAVADIGTHWLDLIQAITGLEAEAVCADLRTVHTQRDMPTGETKTYAKKLAAPQEEQSSAPDNIATNKGLVEKTEIDTEDFGSVLIRFRGGARGVLWVSQVTAGRKNCLQYEIAGSNQTLHWNSESPNSMWVGHRDTANEILTRDPALMHARAGQFSNYPAGHNEGFPDTFKQLFTDFYSAIAQGTFHSDPSFPTFQDGHREVLLCEAILQSARQDRWVEVA